MSIISSLIMILKHLVLINRASQMALMVNNLPANAGGHGKPLQYSCLENPLDREAWRATVHRVAESQTQIKRLSSHALINTALETGLERKTKFQQS